MPCRYRFLLIAVLVWTTVAKCPGQNAVPWRSLPGRVVQDQSLLFSSPFRATKRDLAWLIPLGALTGALIASDHHNFNAHVHVNAAAAGNSNTVTNASLVALAAIPVGLYGLGRLRGQPRLEEGATLAAEAAADSFIVGEVLKLTLRRNRPTVGHSDGGFFSSAWSGGSFPSGHAIVSWSLASAIAHRYPGWLTQLTAYSLATAASVPRITAEKHFPSDVLVGGVLGWLIGREVYQRRHIDWNPVVPAAPSPRRRVSPERERRHPPGPVFVPMDSWVYPALDRLAALGYIHDQASGLRPWTRQECIRQLAEAEEADAYHGTSAQAARLIDALRQEFEQTSDSAYVQLDSVYGRYLGVSGKPLVDGYNFGQTVINDYGRPLSEGSNVELGFSAEAVYDRVSFYTRGEFQHSPAFSSPAGELRPLDHQLEPVVAGSSTAINRFVPLEMYAGIQLGGWALTLGKQELWWGPGAAGPFSFSTNAEPFYSFRFTSTSPMFLPGALRHLGGFRLDIIGGELSGHQFPPRPLLNGQKLTWNPIGSLEIGFTRWSLFDGAGVHGFNAASLVRNLFANGATFANATDPGDRKSGFDFRWRLPGRANRVTLYSDFYADDEPSPLTNPTRSAFAPGIYMASLPGLPSWDLRVESPATRMGTDQGGFFLYWNSVYNDANTNKGNLLGNWVGRDGRGLLAQTTWWHSARSHWDFGYRQNRIGSAFLPGGGTQSDAFVRASFMVSRDWTVGVSAQYERYRIPILGGRRSDVVSGLELTYQPRWKLARK